jgi:hypothetical protein
MHRTRRTTSRKQERSNDMPTPTHTIFGQFSSNQAPGTSVKIQAKLLEEAASSALRVHNTYEGTMRVFNLAQLYGYKYDFHLSFKLDPTRQWADACHFCARDEGAGKNACAYWFYDLRRQPNTNRLIWSFTGSAPDNLLYAGFIESIGITPQTTSPAARRMLARRATEPLDKLLTKFDALIQRGRAAIVADARGTRLQFA